ncbi:LysR family transcriptional regulator [Kineosporia sp. NBRC 101731]|uniref:LysR family transcriptional regulator n=1 Tax=Kineosporia sp. NBRC 101731 TaxID=3032199 RepID=UPI0024A04FA9|nr:LysR family transcriptional regulator [Kineosporia sp. NBRC 101731]GLY29713.1 LysR family transcriptional regulator [Kineosporia sp. NBRC 101731]
MELRHLRYFVVVAQERHFGRAAARLHIAQPPLSQQIRRLEAELGVQLLLRTTRRVELTAAGERYLERAQAVLAAVEAAGNEAVMVSLGDAGHVAIGFTGSATYEVLPALARALRRDLPGITLDLKGEMLTPDQATALLEGTLDLGFLRPPVRESRLEVRVLRSEPLIAVLPEQHPLARRSVLRLKDLRDEPFIGYPSHRRSTVHEAVLEACDQAGFVPGELQEVAETSTLVSFVAAGLGVALVPESVRHLQITGAAYRPLTGTTRRVELAAAMLAGPDRPALRRVLERAEALFTGD